MHASTGYCGSDHNQMVEVEDSITDEELDSWAWQEAVQNAESYGYEEHYHDEECEEGCERDEYSLDQIESYWEEYDEEKHGAKCF